MTDPASPSPRPVLVTGFGPFLTHSTNPSEQAVRRFAERAAPGVVTAILPVDVEDGPRAALELVALHDARALVALGLDATRPSVMVERLAVNLYEHGPVSRELTRHGPAAYRSTLDAVRIRDAIRDAGQPCELSLSAGAFVCNALLFRALEAGVSAVFVHLPAGLAPDAGADVIEAVVSDARAAVDVGRQPVGKVVERPIQHEDGELGHLEGLGKG